MFLEILQLLRIWILLAKTEVKSENDNMKPLFEAIIRQVPPPVGDVNKPLQLQDVRLMKPHYQGYLKEASQKFL